MEEIIKRLSQRDLHFDDDDPRCSYYYRNNCCSTWCSWGRWVFVAAVIIAFFLLFSICACITRRRRSRGLPPYYGTGWMPFHPTHPAGNATQFQTYPQQYDPNYPPQHYDPNNPYTQYYSPTAPAPAPPYTPSPQTTGTHFPTPLLPQETGSQLGYQPPPGHGTYAVHQHSTGGTGGTEYYLPPPGAPPAAHVGKY